MDRHMEAIYPQLDLESNNETRKLGIWGEGGVGKTTVARYVYNKILPHFDAHVFLNDVKEIFQNYGLQGIHEAFVSEYLKGRDPMLSDVIRESLRDQRVLLVADNVDHIDQFDAIAKEIDLVGLGSRVIITTQDRQLLIECGVRLQYEVKSLSFLRELQLFCIFAFKQNHPFVGFEELSTRAVKLAGRFTPAILAVGSRLFGKPKEEWERELYSYKTSLRQSNTCTRKSGFDRSDYRDKSIMGTLRNSENLIGMERHMQALHEVLDIGSFNQLRIIGIWGMGGIGKTSLARHIFEEISKHFHSRVFLENIGKMYQDYGPSRLEEEFLSKNIETTVLTSRGSEGGTNVIKRRLGHRKILFIADGVDNIKQLKDVQKMANLFGPGSRVIVTTQDEGLLLANGVKHVYEVKCLRFGEALQLFFQFAFKQENPSTRFKQLSVRAIELSGCLPLAIKVLGSYLRGRTELDWVDMMQILKENKDADEIEKASQYKDHDKMEKASSQY